MPVIRIMVSFYRTGEEKPCERYKARLKINDQPLINHLKRQIIDDLGLKEQSKRFGLCLFELKLYRLAKMAGRIENFRIATQQKLDLEFPLLVGTDGTNES